MADLTNAKIHIDPQTGGVYLAKYNPDGSVKRMVSPKRIHNPGNMVDNNIDLTATVNSITDSWEDTVKATGMSRGRVGTVTSPAENEAYLDAKEAAINSILTNSRTAANILVDYSTPGLYEFYTGDQKEAMIDEYVEGRINRARQAGRELTEADIQEMREEKERSMIEVIEDETGTMQPILTQEQEDAAYDIVDGELESSIRREEAMTQGRAPRAPKESGDDDKTGGGIYPDLSAAWRLASKGTGSERAENGRKSESQLTNLSGGRYKFKWETGGLAVYNMSDWMDYENPEPIAKNITNLIDISPYIYGSTGAAGTDQARKDFKADRAAYTQSGGGKPNDTDPLGIK
jgi:hypothetical protein